MRNPAEVITRAKEPIPRKTRKFLMDLKPSNSKSMDSVALVCTMSGLPNTDRIGMIEATPATSRPAMQVTMSKTMIPRFFSEGVRSCRDLCSMDMSVSG